MFIISLKLVLIKVWVVVRFGVLVDNYTLNSCYSAPTIVQPLFLIDLSNVINSKRYVSNSECNVSSGLRCAINSDRYVSSCYRYAINSECNVSSGLGYVISIDRYVSKYLRYVNNSGRYVSYS